MTISANLISSVLFNHLYYPSNIQLSCHVTSRHLLTSKKTNKQQQDNVTLKQPSHSFLPSGHPTCQGCSVARPLQRKGWLNCRLQHKEESSSLKYLESEFNLKGVEAWSSHSRCVAVWGIALTQCDVHFCFAFAVLLPPSPFLSSFWFFSFSIFLSPPSIIVSFVMSSQEWCRAGLAVSGEQLVWCSGNITENVVLDKHRSVCCTTARVLQGLTGPGRVEWGKQRGLGGQFLWENSCYHTVISYQGSVQGLCFQLDEIVTTRRRAFVCVCVCCIHKHASECM